jgi:hypothetical protein
MLSIAFHYFGRKAMNFYRFMILSALLVITTSVFGQALSMGGSLNFWGNQAVVFPSGMVDFDPNSSFSISVWVKLNGSQRDYAGIIAKATPRNPMTGFQLLLVNDAPCLEYARNSDRSLLRMRSASSLNDRNWHHLAVVIDRSESRATFYIDGERNKSMVDRNITDDIVNTEPLMIGVERGRDAYFRGSIDDIRIFNHALESDEIDKLARSRK